MTAEDAAAALASPSNRNEDEISALEPGRNLQGVEEGKERMELSRRDAKAEQTVSGERQVRGARASRLPLAQSDVLLTLAVGFTISFRLFTYQLVTLGCSLSTCNVTHSGHVFYFKARWLPTAKIKKKGSRGKRPND
jgi:hypothetical protein